MTVNSSTDLINVIKRKISSKIQVSHLFLKDESYLHAGHNKKSILECTHVFLQLVSDDFINSSLLQRHKKINDILRKEYARLHSLRIEVLSKAEYKCKYIINSPVNYCNKDN